MELINLVRVVRRWSWLIVALVVVTQVGLWLGTRSADPVYTASIQMQISTPQREEVAAYDEYRSINLRDEITVAINNFVELLQSDEVYKRTITQLGLKSTTDRPYAVEAERLRDADFVNVTVEASTADLAAKTANTHVAIAIAYYGELRAKSTKAEKTLFTEQLRVAEADFQSAEKALADFRTQNGIFSLESQLATQQKLLEQLQLERDQRLLQASSAISGMVAAPVDEVDKLITQREQEQDSFAALAPQYNILAQKAEEAQARYQHLLAKYNEADLKVTAVQAANFIQVIKPAYAPLGSDSSWPKLAVLALAGSLGLGVVLAFLLQYLFGLKLAGAAVLHGTQKSSSHVPADLEPLAEHAGGARNQDAPVQLASAQGQVE